MLRKWADSSNILNCRKKCFNIDRRARRTRKKSMESCSFSRKRFFSLLKAPQVSKRVAILIIFTNGVKIANTETWLATRGTFTFYETKETTLKKMFYIIVIRQSFFFKGILLMFTEILSSAPRLKFIHIHVVNSCQLMWLICL